MDITLFFSPVKQSLYEATYGHSSFFSSIRVYGEKTPEYRDAQIAIFGMSDERGNPSNKGCLEAPDAIREKLYLLKKGTGSYRIVDLGNLNPGADLEETYTRLSEVCRTLLEQNILPVILGNTHDQDYGQYHAYQDLDKLINFLNVDAFLDMEEEQSIPSKKHIQDILLHEPNYLFGYTHLAHQTYLIDANAINTLEKLYFEAYRVGKLHTNLIEMEPSIRNADLLSFDISAIRSSDAPGNSNAQPFGLSGEEACQICWYAGHNEKLSSFGVYEYNPLLDDAAHKTAAVIATMVWYFIEGYYHRKNEKNFKSNDFMKYIVPMPVAPETIVFYKSKFTSKWWMEISRSSADRYGRKSIIPCSYADYQTASRGELPERYIQAINRLE